MFKKIIAVSALTTCLVSSANAGGIPVFDGANLAQAVVQVESWAKQYDQMESQLSEWEKNYNAVTGVRGMGSLVNNPEVRKYLPKTYGDMLSDGVGNWEEIYKSAKSFDKAMSQLSDENSSWKNFQILRKQIALNRAAAEKAYNSANQRFDDIQVLVDKVNDAPDPKDIADLQARIQAEQVMMQNEASRLQTLALLANAQREIQHQQIIERRLMSTRGTMPSLMGLIEEDDYDYED